MKLKAKHNYELIRATIADLPIIMNFQSAIINNMDRKDWFCPLYEQEFIDPINSNKGVYLVYDKANLIALAVLNIKPDKEIMKEYQLANINGVALFDSIMVKEDYRGNKITQAVLKYIYKEAKRKNIKIIIATIHPENIHSLENFINNGYSIMKKINIHGGPRYIMKIDIK
jgi:GNAT superfamily N-acetyltransferase